MAARERTGDGRSRARDDSAVLDREAVYEYSPPNQLVTLPDGEYTYRWVTEAIHGEPVPDRTQVRLAEKYERVNRAQLPDEFYAGEDTKGDGYVRTGGLILMRMPTALNQSRARFFQKLSQDRLKGVNDLQGVAGRDAVEEDRGTRSLSGADARSALQDMSNS